MCVLYVFYVVLCCFVLFYVTSCALCCFMIVSCCVILIYVWFMHHLCILHDGLCCVMLFYVVSCCFMLFYVAVCRFIYVLCTFMCASCEIITWPAWRVPLLAERLTYTEDPSTVGDCQMHITSDNCSENQQQNGNDGEETNIERVSRWVSGECSVQGLCPITCSLLKYLTNTIKNSFLLSEWYLKHFKLRPSFRNFATL